MRKGCTLRRSLNDNSICRDVRARSRSNAQIVDRIRRNMDVLERIKKFVVRSHRATRSNIDRIRSDDLSEYRPISCGEGVP